MARRYCAAFTAIAMPPSVDGYRRAPMSSSTILLLVLLATIVVSMAVAGLIVRAGRSRADASLSALGPPQRSTAASALGRTGDPAEPLKGTGTLVLTATEVGFAQWRPARLLRIPRADIATVDTTREHLGKTMKHDVLRITWRDSGIEETVAFFVRDLDPWLQDLGGHRARPPDA